MLAVFQTVSRFSGGCLRRTEPHQPPWPPCRAGLPCSREGRSQVLEASSTCQVCSPHVYCSPVPESRPGLGLFQGKARTWRGSCVLSLPFRLAVGPLGVAGVDQEGLCPRLHQAAPQAAWPTTLPWCFSPLGTKGTRQQGWKGVPGQARHLRKIRASPCMRPMQEEAEAFTEEMDGATSPRASNEPR